MAVGLKFEPCYSEDDLRWMAGKGRYQVGTMSNQVRRLIEKGEKREM